MSEMPRCKDCRWWESATGTGHEEFIKDWGICHLFDDPERSKLMMYGYISDAQIGTAPDFGCVQWEAKP